MLRVVDVVVNLANKDDESSKVPSRIPEGADDITVPLRHGPRYAMLVGGRWVIVFESRASRSLFRRRGMFKPYVLLDGMFVNTASGQAIPVVGTVYP